MTWKNSLSHDWIPVEKAKTFPLREFYVGLKWVRVVKRAIQNFKQELNSIHEILEMLDSTERPKFRKILITGNSVRKEPPELLNNELQLIYSSRKL